MFDFFQRHFYLSDLLLCSAFIGLIGLAPWVAQAFHRRWSIDPFILRKVIHLLSALLFIPVVFFLSGRGWGMAVSVVMVGGNLVAGQRRENAPNRWLAGLLHAGALVVLGLLWMRSDFRPVVIPIVVMGFGDALAALIGRKWGRTRLPGFQVSKTTEGTAAGFWVATGVVVLLMLLIGGTAPHRLWGAGVPAAAIFFEPFLPGPWDNPALLILAGLGTLLVS